MEVMELSGWGDGGDGSWKMAFGCMNESRKEEVIMVMVVVVRDEWGGEEEAGRKKYRRVLYSHAYA